MKPSGWIIKAIRIVSSLRELCIASTGLTQGLAWIAFSELSLCSTDLRSLGQRPRYLLISVTGGPEHHNLKKKVMWGACENEQPATNFVRDLKIHAVQGWEVRKFRTNGSDQFLCFAFICARLEFFLLLCHCSQQAHETHQRS